VLSNEGPLQAEDVYGVRREEREPSSSAQKKTLSYADLKTMKSAGAFNEEAKLAYAQEE